LEKHEYVFIGPFIGGIVLLFLGFTFYLALTSSFGWEAAWAWFLILVGLALLGGAVYAVVMATRRKHQLWKTLGNLHYSLSKFSFSAWDDFSKQTWRIDRLVMNGPLCLQ
jgi:hypothetical protein